MKIIQKIAGATIITTAAILLTSGLQAQDTLRPNLRELIPVEIRGLRVDDKTPFSVTNLDSADLRKFNNVQDLPYLLNQTPSVNITSDAGAGVGYTGIHIRGTDASRINFTLNGIPLNDAEAQTALFVDLPDLLGSTQSIQIQRGVGSSTNGAGAFGASVNMSNTEQSLIPAAEWSTGFGSFKTLRNSLRLSSGKLKGGFQFDLRLSKINSDGYIDRAFSDLKSLQFISGWTSKNSRTSLKFQILTGKERTGQAWNGVPEDSLKTNRRYNGLGLMPNGKYYKNQTDNYQQDYYQLFFNHRFNSYWDFHTALFLTRGKGYYDEYRDGDLRSDYGLPPFIPVPGDTLNLVNLTRQLWLNNYYYGSLFSLNYHKNKTEINLGTNLSRYDGRHYGIITSADYAVPIDYQWYYLTAYKNDFSIFTKVQQQIGANLFLFGDLQYRHIDYKMNGFRENPDVRPFVHYNFVNPKAGLSYIFTHPDNSVSKLSVSFALADKEPNRDDFEAEVDDLPQPERLYDWEINYNYKGYNWGLELNGYYMNYHNQLILTGAINDVGVYTRTNVPLSYREGLEVGFWWQPVKPVILSGNTTISRNKIKDFHEFVDDYDQNKQQEFSYSSTDIGFSPNLIGFGQISFQPLIHQLQQAEFFIDLSTKYVSRQYLDNTESRDRSLTPYTTTDLQFRFNLKPRFIKELGLQFGLNNIFNRLYESNGYTYSYIDNGQRLYENNYFPQAGFNFIFGLNLKF